MKKNLFYAMIAVAFLMVGCGSDTGVSAATTTGDNLTGKAGGAVSAPAKSVEAPRRLSTGSDTGR